MSSTIVFAQDVFPVLPKAKRFIDKLEVFAGPNLSYNHGNLFIENYRGEYANNNYVVNRRLLKPGYIVGVGAYHPLTNGIGLNVRLQYERKGTKNELNNPLNAVNSDARQITKSDYTYNCITINMMPVFYLSHKRRWSISFGAYYSKIKSVKGLIELFNTQDAQIHTGSFEGRYFYHFREDGGIDGSSWNPFLTGIEDNDIGVVLSVGYKIPLNEKHVMAFHLQDNYGFQNINKDDHYRLQEKNHSIVLIICYSFSPPQKK